MDPFLCPDISGSEVEPATHQWRLKGAAFLVAMMLTPLARPCSIHAQAIVGRVVDGVTGEGVPTVSVEVRDSDDGILGTDVSGEAGLFRVLLAVGGGPFRLETTHMAYGESAVDSLFVGESEEVILPAIRLEPAPIALDPIVARAPPPPRVTRGQEWIRRHQLEGKGAFFAGAILEVLNPPSLTEYIAAQTGLSLSIGSRGQKGLWHPDSRNGEDCIVVRLNRWPLTYPIDEIPIAGVAGIEVYKDAIDVPLGYAWDHGKCGLVNIWLWNSWR